MIGLIWLLIGYMIIVAKYIPRKEFASMSIPVTQKLKVEVDVHKYKRRMNLFTASICVRSPKAMLGEASYLLVTYLLKRIAMIIKETVIIR